MQATTSAEEKMPNGIFFFAQNLIWNMTMNDKLKLYHVTDHYLDFLRKVEPKIPENKDNGKARPFVGIILSINGVKYIAPLSSQIRKSQSDFKVKSGDEQKATIRFAYMFPIVDSALIEILTIRHYSSKKIYTSISIKNAFTKLQLKHIPIRSQNVLALKISVATLPSWKKYIGNIKLNKNCPGVSARAIFIISYRTQIRLSFQLY